MYFDDQVEFVGSGLLEGSEYSEWRVEVRRDSVVHDYHLPFRRGQFEHLCVLELGVVHILVEITVLYYHISDRIIRIAAPCHHKTVVESNSE